MLKTLAFLRRRLLRIQRHLIYTATCNAAEEPHWLPGEQVFLASRNKLWDAAISDQLLSISRENKDYLEAIFDGEAEGLAVVRDGKLVHYGFLMYRNRTARLLDFGNSIGYRVPRWPAVGKLACDAAKAFLPLRTVGWDVAITLDQPCLIEGNVTWDTLSGEPRMGEIYRFLQNLEGTIAD